MGRRKVMVLHADLKDALAGVSRVTCINVRRCDKQKDLSVDYISKREARERADREVCRMLGMLDR